MRLHFDFSSEVPLYLQLHNQVIIGIAQGKLCPGEHLPTIRALAAQSGINMMTVSKAYQLLRQEGYIQTDRRSGAVIAPRPGQAAVAEQTLQALRLCLAQLQLAGMSKQEVLALCGKLYEEDVS